jgi:hypothetical protein
VRLIFAASAVLVFYGFDLEPSPRASSRPVSSLDPQHNFQQHKARIFSGCRDGEADGSGLQSAFGRGSTVVKLWTSGRLWLADAPKAESGEMAVFVGSSREPMQPKPRLR